MRDLLGENHALLEGNTHAQNVEIIIYVYRIVISK